MRIDTLDLETFDYDLTEEDVNPGPFPTEEDINPGPFPTEEDINPGQTIELCQITRAELVERLALTAALLRKEGTATEIHALLTAPSVERGGLS